MKHINRLLLFLLMVVVFTGGYIVNDLELTGQGVLKLNTLKADETTTYTKGEIDTKLNLKGDKNLVDNNTTNISNLNRDKANKNEIYTRTETDTKLNLKADKTQLTPINESINKLGVEKANVTEVNLKADKTQLTPINESINKLGVEKANVTEVNKIKNEFQDVVVHETLWEGQGKQGQTLTLNNSLDNYEQVRFHVSFVSGSYVLEKNTKNISTFENRFWLTGIGMTGDGKGMYAGETTIDKVTPTQMKVINTKELNTVNGVLTNVTDKVCISKIEGVKKKVRLT